MEDVEGQGRVRRSLGAGGRYLVKRELGRGMMGVVYEAEDTLLGRVVAVKMIELAIGVSREAHAEFERRFFTEAQIAAKLSHPGIVVCHDTGKDPSSGKLFIVFEFLKGQNLAERVAAGPIAWPEALAIVVRIARAIQHAHEHGVVHRDLKPANVMLLAPVGEGGAPAAGDTAVKIMDFGVAKLESIDARLTATGQWFGSPAYVSPEQALGHVSDTRSDIFSLGSILCTLLLGRPWFEAPSIPSTLERVVHAHAPRLSVLRPELPEALDHVVAHALAKGPADRYRSAADMASDLEHILSGGSPQLGVAEAAPASAASEPTEDLLSDLVTPAGDTAAAPPDHAEPLAALVDEAPAQPPQAHPGLPPPEPATPTGRHTTASARRRSLRRLSIGMIVGAILVAGAVAFVLEGRPSPESMHALEEESPAASMRPVADEDAPTPAPPSAATDSPDAPPITAPSVRAPTPPDRPTETEAPAGAQEAAPTVPAPASAVPRRPTPAAPPEPSAAWRQARLKLDLKHPLENGRLIVWLDGVVVFETKLRAAVARRIVGIAIREGQVETMLDVDPGRHELRIEVSWEGESRTASQVVDVAPASTGLLEVRMGRIGKGLSLEWSRLAAR